MDLIMRPDHWCNHTFGAIVLLVVVPGHGGCYINTVLGSVWKLPLSHLWNPSCHIPMVSITFRPQVTGTPWHGCCHHPWIPNGRMERRPAADRLQHHAGNTARRITRRREHVPRGHDHRYLHCEHQPRRYVYPEPLSRLDLLVIEIIIDRIGILRI